MCQEKCLDESTGTFVQEGHSVHLGWIDEAYFHTPCEEVKHNSRKLIQLFYYIVIRGYVTKPTLLYPCYAMHSCLC